MAKFPGLFPFLGYFPNYFPNYLPNLAKGIFSCLIGSDNSSIHMAVSREIPPFEPTTRNTQTTRKSDVIRDPEPLLRAASDTARACDPSRSQIRSTREPKKAIPASRDVNLREPAPWPSSRDCEIPGGFPNFQPLPGTGGYGFLTRESGSSAIRFCFTPTRSLPPSWSPRPGISASLESSASYRSRAVSLHLCFLRAERSRSTRAERSLAVRPRADSNFPLAAHLTPAGSREGRP